MRLNVALLLLALVFSGAACAGGQRPPSGPGNAPVTEKTGNPEDSVLQPAPELEPESVSELIIDIHAHVLNAWDIPAAPFLRKNKPLLTPLAGVLASRLRKGAPKYRAVGTRGEDSGTCLVDLRDSADAGPVCSDEQAARLFREILAEDPALQEEFGGEVLRGDGRQTTDWATEGPRLIRFLSAFHRSRLDQAWTLLELYPEVNLFTPSMVDMDGWPGADERLPSLQERLDAMGSVMLALNEVRPGVIHPFLPFNPRHGIEGLPEYIEGYHDIIESALANDGFLGVKIYPAFGYFPVDNETTPTTPKYHPERAAEIDRELLWLYAFAQEEGIPVLAHCTATGAELGKRHAEVYGHPENWRPVLERFPALRLSLGHFGKAAGIVDSDDAEAWPRIIAKMMRDHPNLYADLALDGVPSHERFVLMLDGLKAMMEDQPALRTRLMYGTDWFMLLLDKGSSEYFERYREEFNDERFGETTRRAFFGGNAVEFLGLKDPRTQVRLRRYYESRSLGEPKWLTGDPP